MRFNVLDLLFPRETKFFGLFDEHAGRLLAAARALRGIVDGLVAEGGLKDRDAFRAQVAEVDGLERAADKVEAKINEAIEESFITPFDREDIHLIGVMVDNAVDSIKALAHKIDNYAISRVPPRAADFAGLIVEGAQELVEIFEKMEKRASISATAKRIGEIERKGDLLFSIAIGDLFRDEKDPISVIKCKEVFEGLEDVVNRLDDAGKVLRRVMIKQG